jgi:hypothetical protein
MTKHYFVAAALISSLSAYGQESRGETQASRCGALAFIHTSMTTSNPAFGEAMTEFGQFYGAVFAAHRKVRTGSAVVNKDVSDRRELALQEFKKTWTSNPDAVIREAALCNAWRADFAPRLVARKEAAGTDAELVRLVGEPPARPTAAEVERWRPIVPQAFAAWEELDYATPASVRQNLVESLKRP